MDVAKEVDPRREEGAKQESAAMAWAAAHPRLLKKVGISSPC